MPGKRTFSQFSQSQGPKKSYRRKHYAKQRSTKYITSVNNAGAGTKDSFGMWNIHHIRILYSDISYECDP